MDRINWDELWKQRNEEAVGENSGIEFWNTFAESFRKKIKPGEDEYVEKFYKMMDIRSDETLFDMGCASGTLAIPFALKGHDVYAADFAPDMLKVLKEGAKEAGVADRIHPIRLDWNEDWSKRDLPLCDVAISSRSLICSCLSGALMKLESVARRRICIGAWDTPCKYYDRYLAKAIGYERPGYGVYWYVINELMDRDLLPEMRFLKSPFKPSRFESYDKGVETLKKSFIYGLTKEQESKLEKYCSEHLKHHEGSENYTSARDNGKIFKEFWRLDHDDASTIAFISWNKKVK